MNLTGGLVNFSSLNRGNGSGVIDKMMQLKVLETLTVDIFNFWFIYQDS